MHIRPFSKIRFRWFLLCVLFTAISLPAGAGDLPEADTAATQQTLRILSWNIHMLPPFAYVNGKRKRARQIGKELCDEGYDIIVFQEAFHHGARRKIEKQMCAYTYRIGPANARYVTLRTSSGIWIISRIPIQKVDKVKFREVATRDDKLARKGALMVEGVVGGRRFQLVGTHLNAGGPIEVRHSQVMQIRDELLKPYEENGVIQIIAGDMNMRMESDNYPFMLETYDAIAGPLEVSEAMRSGCADKHDRPFRDDVIDFIFLRENGVELKQVVWKVPCFEAIWNKEGKTWLSDHPPMEIDITF